MAKTIRSRKITASRTDSSDGAKGKSSVLNQVREITAETEQIGRAEALHQKSEMIHEKADTPRHGAEALHRRVRTTRRELRKGTEREAPEKTGDGRRAFPVVGVGASAGGFEAFVQLLEHLPAKTGMAF